MRLRRDDRVLVRIPNWLGDAVMALPALQALAEHVSPERLTLAGPERLAAFVASTLGGVRTVPPDEFGAWRGHDVAVLLTGSFRSAFHAWRAGIPERVGWARDGRTLLLTVAARPAFERGATPVGLGRVGRSPRVLPRPFGTTANELVSLIGVPVRDTAPRIESTAEAREAVDLRLARLGLLPSAPFLVVNCGSRPNSAKGAPPELWADAMASVGVETGLEFVAVGGPGEETVVREICVRAGRRGARVCSLVDPAPDLAELVRLFERADLVLTADSGPRHLATAAGAAVVCLFGPTDPRHTADHTRRTRSVRTVVPCGPCHQELCPLPDDAAHRCMREIDPALISRAVAALA